MKTPERQVEDSLRTIREEFENPSLDSHDVSIYEDRAIIDTKLSNDCDHNQVTWVVYGEGLTHLQISSRILDTQL